MNQCQNTYNVAKNFRRYLWNPYKLPLVKRGYIPSNSCYAFTYPNARHYSTFTREVYTNGDQMCIKSGRNVLAGAATWIECFKMK